MPEINCNDINDPLLLVSHFREKKDDELNNLFKCFFELFYNDFKHLTKKFCEDRYYTKNKEEDLAVEALHDGLLEFYFSLRTEGFRNRGEKIKTVFFSFNLNKLMALFKKLERHAVRESIVDNDNTGNMEGGMAFTDEPFDSVLLQEEQEKHVAMLNAALAELGEKRTNLIIWKKMLRLSNGEIAGKLEMQPGSVDNEVFKSFRKLKEIVDRHKAKNTDMDLTLEQYENIQRYLDAELSPEKERNFFNELQRSPVLQKYLLFEEELRGNLEFMQEKSSQAGKRVEDNFEEAPLVKSLIKKAWKEWKQEKLGSSKPMPTHHSPLREEFERYIAKKNAPASKKPWPLVALTASLAIVLGLIIWLLLKQS